MILQFLSLSRAGAKVSAPLEEMIKNFLPFISGKGEGKVLLNHRPTDQTQSRLRKKLCSVDQ